MPENQRKVAHHHARTGTAAPDAFATVSLEFVMFRKRKLKGIRRDRSKLDTNEESKDEVMAATQIRAMHKALSRLRDSKAIDSSHNSIQESKQTSETTASSLQNRGVVARALDTGFQKMNTVSIADKFLYDWLCSCFCRYAY